MKVKDLIKELQKFNPELEVTITDGYCCQHYIGDFEVNILEDHNENYFVDIGIGGLNENEE